MLITPSTLPKEPEKPPANTLLRDYALSRGAVRQVLAEAVLVLRQKPEELAEPQGSPPDEPARKHGLALHPWEERVFGPKEPLSDTIVKMTTQLMKLHGFYSELKQVQQGLEPGASLEPGLSPEEEALLLRYLLRRSGKA
jgi:hypothetical protein